MFPTSFNMTHNLSFYPFSEPNALFAILGITWVLLFVAVVMQYLHAALAAKKQKVDLKSFDRCFSMLLHANVNKLQQIQGLKKKVQEVECDNDALFFYNCEAIAEIRELKTENMSLLSASEEQWNEILDLEDEVLHLSDAILDQDDEIIDLQAKNDALLIAKQEHLEEIIDLEDEVLDQEREIISLENSKKESLYAPAFPRLRPSFNAPLFPGFRPSFEAPAFPNLGPLGQDSFRGHKLASPFTIETTTGPEWQAFAEALKKDE